MALGNEFETWGNPGFSLTQLIQNGIAYRPLKFTTSSFVTLPVLRLTPEFVASHPAAAHTI